MPETTPRGRTAVIVEDDADLRHLLVEVLEAAGFTTASADNGLAGVQAVLESQPLITTLDVNMPGIDGIEAARRIRAQSDTYIIMITANGEETDVVMGLTAGADEYITKPFRPREFRARVEAMLRRPRSSASEMPAPAAPVPARTGAESIFAGAVPVAVLDPEPAPIALVAPAAYARGVSADRGPDESAATILDAPPAAAHPVDVSTAGEDDDADEGAWLTHRNLRLDPDSRIVLIDGSELDLTRTEFDLLAALMESKRRVRSKADLTLVLRGESYVTSYFVGDADKRAIEAHMTNLRRKLGDNPVQPRFIETVRGVGYRLTSEVSGAA